MRYNYSWAPDRGAYGGKEVEVKKPAMTLILIMGMAGTAFAAAKTIVTDADGWRLNLRLSVGSAETRLTLGESPDAMDSKDGRYDVPALLSGELMAYMTLDGEKYWQDIKKTCQAPPAPCKKRWDIVVESPLKGATVSLRWSPPAENLTLTDLTTGKAVDMKTTSFYKYNNKDGKREFRIEAQR